MADQGKWFKLWVSALDDPDLDNLDISDFGRWAKFGAHMKEQGENGKIVIHNPSRTLCAKLQVNDFNELISCIKKFPKCIVTTVTNGNVTYSVEFKNWHKYQGDISTPRVYKMREKLKKSIVSTVTPQEEKRREEKRRDKNKNISTEISTNSFIKKYCELFFGRYGKNPIITPKDSGIAAKISKLPEAATIIERFFNSKDKFIIENCHSLNILYSQINKLMIEKSSTQNIPTKNNTLDKIIAAEKECDNAGKH